MNNLEIGDFVEVHKFDNSITYGNLLTLNCNIKFKDIIYYCYKIKLMDGNVLWISQDRVHKLSTEEIFLLKLEGKV